MKEFREAMRYAFLALKSELTSPKWLVTGICIFCFIQYCFGGISAYLSSQGERMNLFELYNIFMADRSSQMIYIAGLLLLSCGVSFFKNTGVSCFLIRGGRNSWIQGQILYTFLIVLLYNLFLFTALGFSCGWMLTISDRWSEAAFIGCQFGVTAINMEPITSIPYAFLELSPTCLGLLTFFLQIGAGMVLELVLVYANAVNRNVFGVAAILILWFASAYIDDNLYSTVTIYLSPFSLSRISNLDVAGASVSILYAAGFFIFIAAAMIFMLGCAVNRIDFTRN